MIKHRESILLSVTFLMVTSIIYAFAEDSTHNPQDLSVLWKQQEQLGPIADTDLGSVFSGDILILEVHLEKNKLVLTRPIVLQEPYFETLKEQYLTYGYNNITKFFCIKSSLGFDYGSSGHEFGYMIFGANNYVRFRPLDIPFFQWAGAWGYQAYMEESDIVFWLERETAKPAPTLKLCKHNALVWDFPLIKNKYVQMDIYWESASVRNFAMSFFRGIRPSHPEIVSWRLGAVVIDSEVFYGWEE